MRLVTFKIEGTQRLGAVQPEGIVDILRAFPEAPNDMIGLIAAWPRVGAGLRESIAGRPADFPLADVHLLAPVPRPRKILAIGLNYADHIAESGQETPANQTWFAKMPSAANGPFDPILLPKVSTALDYEAELVAVIGQCPRHATRAQARDAIFGYCAGNDVSVRDWQFQTSQWIVGKSFDSHAPFGPWIVTADEIGEPHALDIRCSVNGVLRQNSNTRHLVFDLFDQIAHLSRAMTLEPGDVIFSGTPGGVGFAMKPPAFLNAGDLVRVEIGKIGAIEARVVPEAR